MKSGKLIKAAALTGACFLFTLAPASNAFSDYSDTLLVDSYYNDILDVLIDIDSSGSGSDILLEDNSYASDSLITDDIAVPAGSDVLLTDNSSDILSGSYRSSGSTAELLTDDSRNDAGSSSKGQSTTNSSTNSSSTAKATASKPSSGNSSTGTVSRDSSTETVSRKTTSSDPTIDAVIREINKKRSAAGVGPVSSSSELNYVAAQRVKEITQRFSHTRPNGRESVTILYDYGVDAGRTGENIACCVSSPEGVVAAWASSPSHKRCMLNGDYARAGVGTIVSGGCTYWVLILTD